MQNKRINNPWSRKLTRTSSCEYTHTFILHHARCPNRVMTRGVYQRTKKSTSDGASPPSTDKIVAPFRKILSPISVRTRQTPFFTCVRWMENYHHHCWVNNSPIGVHSELSVVSVDQYPFCTLNIVRRYRNRPVHIPQSVLQSCAVDQYGCHGEVIFWEKRKWSKTFGGDKHWQS